MMAATKRKPGRVPRFSDAFKVAWTAEQSAYLSSEAERRCVPMAEIVRQAVQAAMEAGK